MFRQERAHAETSLSGDWAVQLEQLWLKGGQPDLAEFLERCGQLSVAQVAAIVRVDQWQRWHTDTPVRVETYLHCFPALASDATIAVDLVCSEYLLQVRLGQPAKVDEFVFRFPQFAVSLRQQIELHRAFGESSDGRDDDTPDETSPRFLPAASEASEFLAGHIPLTLGRYRIVNVIGRGGMGAVYRAHDTRLDRPVALKVILTGARADTGQIRRFYREARAAASVNHPNLCPVYDVGTVRGIPYLTMPALPGTTLAAHLAEQGQIPEVTATRWTIQLARALHAAHQAGVTHRDLKPANIIINERQEPVVIDFGLAALANDTTHLTPTDAFVGTPAYMPPEQLMGQAPDQGASNDIYSLGVILYEMLAGKRPFTGTIFEIVRQIGEAEPVPLTCLRQDVDPRLALICHKAMSKQPQSRFASMSAFAEALATITPIHPTSNAAPPRTFRATVRRYRAILVPALSIVALAGALGLPRWNHQRAAPVHQNGSSSTPSPADSQTQQGPLTGESWIGTFVFREPITNYSGEVELIITGRDANTFTGEYATEGGRWRWAIRGQIDNTVIQWTFSDTILEPEPRQLVGRARVDGEVHGDTITAVFSIPETDAAADLTLRRK